MEAVFGTPIFSPACMNRFLVTGYFLCFGFLLLGQTDRSVDGFGNNRDHPEWGSTGSLISRWMLPDFADGIGAPAGAFRPNARVVSNEIFSQPQRMENTAGFSEFFWAFGQLIDHDVNLVSSDPLEPLPVKVPLNDAYFEPNSLLPFFRSRVAPGYGEQNGNSREYLNEVTAFLDGSAIYGSDEDQANWLRTFQGGYLKTSPGNLLPWNTKDLTFNGFPDPDAPKMVNGSGTGHRLFVAGDVRANEHPLLISLHTVFVREHNRICDSLNRYYAHWGDELIYQRARKMVGAIIQAIGYHEWLPAAGIALPEYTGYHPSVDPGISQLVSAAAFQLAPTLISDQIVRLDKNNDTLIQGNLTLREAIYQPALIPVAGGIEPYLRGASNRNQEELDWKIVDGIRNFLSNREGMPAMDLAVQEIMLGRDRGLPDYHTIRKAMGLPALTSIAEINRDAHLTDRLVFLYGNVDNIDPWVGLIAEEPGEGKWIGPALETLLVRQFMNLRDGDRYYFENDPAFNMDEINIIKATRLSDVIRRNTDFPDVPDDLFRVRETPDPDKGPDLLPVPLDMVAYPNPVSKEVRLQLYLTEAARVDVFLMDPFGRRVSKYTVEGTEGINSLRIPRDQQIPPGVYFIQVTSGLLQHTVRLYFD